jgi:DNA-binding NarL/FixJ family response regulator
MAVFTHRELQIARLVTAGLSNKEIASRLFVAEGTVKCHVHNILVKAKVGSRAALAKYGRERGLA